MRRLYPLVVLVLGGLVGGSLVPARIARCADDPAPPRFVVSSGWQWTISDSEPVFGPYLRAYRLSPDGNAIAALQCKRTPEESLRPDHQFDDDTDYRLVYWDRFTRQTREVWRYRATTDEKICISQFEWFPDSAHISFEFYRRVRGSDGKDHPADALVFVDTRKGSVRTVPLTEGFVVGLAAAPNANVVALAVNRGEEYVSDADVWLLDASGQRIRSIALPTRNKSVVPFVEWVDSNTLFALRMGSHDEAGVTVSDTQGYVIDVPSGKLRQLDKGEKFPMMIRDKPQTEPGETLPLRLVTEDTPATAKTPATTTLFLEAAMASGPANGSSGENRRVLVAGDATGIHLVGAKDGTAGILYTVHGTLLYAPLLRQPKK